MFNKNDQLKIENNQPKTENDQLKALIKDPKTDVSTFLRIQYETIIKLRDEMKFNEDDEFYLISIDWLKKWQKYVDSKIKNCGEIDNSDLIWCNKFDNSKRNKIDYVIASPDIWNKLHYLYKGGPILKFKLIFTGEEFVPNDNPLNIYVRYKSSEKLIITNKNVFVSQLKKKIYKLFRIPSKAETKIADIYNNSFIKYLNDETTLYIIQIYDGQKIIVCRKHKNGAYKFDQKIENLDYCFSVESWSSDDELIDNDEINNEEFLFNLPISEDF